MLRSRPSSALFIPAAAESQVQVDPLFEQQALGARQRAPCTVDALLNRQHLLVLAVGGEYADRWVASLAAIVPTLAVIPWGTRLRRRLSPVGFELAVVVLLALTALVLIARMVA